MIRLSENELELVCNGDYSELYPELREMYTINDLDR